MTDNFDYLTDKAYTYYHVRNMLIFKHILFLEYLRYGSDYYNIFSRTAP